MDNGVAVAIVNGVFALGVAGLAYQNTRIEKHAKNNNEALQETKDSVKVIERHAKSNEKTLKEAKESMEVLEKRTNGEMDEKIRNAVRDVFAENFPEVTSAVVSEALNDLLTQVILNNDEEEGK